METEIRYGRNVYNDYLLSLWTTNGVEIECAYGKTWLGAFWMLCRRVYRRDNLRYLFKVRYGDKSINYLYILIVLSKKQLRWGPSSDTRLTRNAPLQILKLYQP